MPQVTQTQALLPLGPMARRSPEHDRRTPAIVLADGCFDTLRGKVAHGLVRGGERFAVQAVVDRSLAGRDAAALLDSTAAGIPIVANVAEALRRFPHATAAVVGEAPHGGRLTSELRSMLADCAAAGLDLISGLHDHLCDDAELSQLAAANGGRITDVRRTRPASELRFWDGSVHNVRATRVAVLGTDCAIGKRTTARILAGALNARGTSTEMIYTGQTGWMQGGRYGIIFDSLVSDFIAGELEGAIVSCAAEVDPDVMIIEGQGALRNPAGPCGATLMLSAAVSGVILQHSPHRNRYDGLANVPGCEIPSLASEIALIGCYGVPVLAVVVNLTGIADSDRGRWLTTCRAQCGDIPVVDVFDGGVPRLIEAVFGAAKSLAA